MAHDIFGDRFARAYGTEPTWHRIGKTWQPGEISASEAIADVTAGIIVDRYALSYRVDDGPWIATDQYAVVRRPTSDDAEFRQLGIVSDRWHPTGYLELARQLDPITDRYPVETAGVLANGGLAFLCLRGPTLSITDGKKKHTDENQSYFTANFSLTPNRDTDFLRSLIRVVCANTNFLAHKRAIDHVDVGHTVHARGKMALAGDLLARLAEEEKRQKQIADAMASTPCTVEGMRQIFAAAFPEPNEPKNVGLLRELLKGKANLRSDVVDPNDKTPIAKNPRDLDLLLQSQGGLDAILEQNRSTVEALFRSEGQYACNRDRARRLQEAAMERHEILEPSWMKGTVWGAYNAATEVSDWREGARADESSFAGARKEEKVRAFDAAFSLVEKEV